MLARKYVFNNYKKIKVGKELFGVYLISGVGLLIHQVSMLAFVEVAYLNLYIAKILTSFIVLLWNYNIRRKYLYGEGLE